MPRTTMANTEQTDYWNAAAGEARECPGRQAGKRELMAPRGDKRYVRRDSKGRIAKSVEVGRSLSADRRRKAKGVAKRGQGDRGDERR